MNIKSIFKIKSLVKGKYFFFLFLIFMMTFSFCQKSSNNEKLRVDFSKREEINSFPNGSGPPVTAAVSAMTSPKENFSYYNDIFDYISTQTGRRILFKQRKTYQEVNDLLRYKELDFAFVCSGAYVEAKNEFSVEILAVPQIKGKTNYFAYIIVREDSGIENFADLKGKSFAFTDPLSNTGYLYPQYLIAKMNQSAEEFFSRIIYTHAHDYSIHAVENKIVDGASVDSLIFDYIRETHPDRITNLKVIKTSDPFGMPPVVIHPEIAPQLKEEIRSVLLNMNQKPQGKEILSHLSIDRFVLCEDRDYDSIRMMKTFIQEQNYENQNFSP